jgi:hypothetical protein
MLDQMPIASENFIRTSGGTGPTGEAAHHE